LRLFYFQRLRAGFAKRFNQALNVDAFPELVFRTETDLALLCKHYKIDALDELPESRFDAVKSALEKKLA